MLNPWISLSMLNPWISLSFQTVRLGWRTQDAMVSEFFRMASAGASDLTQTSPLSNGTVAAKESPEAAFPDSIEQLTPRADARQVVTRAAAEQVINNHKKSPRRNKRRHSK